MRSSGRSAGPPLKPPQEPREQGHFGVAETAVGGMPRPGRPLWISATSSWSFRAARPGDGWTHLAAVAVRAVAPAAGLLENRASGRSVLRMQGHSQKRTGAECNRNSHGSFMV